MFKKLCWPASAWWSVIVALWEDPEAEGELDNCVLIIGYVIFSLLIGFCIIAQIWSGIRKFFA